MKAGILFLLRDRIHGILHFAYCLLPIAYFFVRAGSLRRCACDADGFPIEYQMSIRMMKLGMAIGEMPTHEYPRLGGQSTAHSWPTGVVFIKTLLREISLGRMGYD